MKPKILISACLLGEAVRYDGQSKPADHPSIRKWKEDDRLVSICPEVLGGLSVPRERAEKKRDRIVSESGVDVTSSFEAGAEIVQKLALKENIKVAILKEKSPSCGSKQIYDGSFEGNLIEGKGLTTLALESIGVRVFGESELEAAFLYVTFFYDS